MPRKAALPLAGWGGLVNADCAPHAQATLYRALTIRPLTALMHHQPIARPALRPPIRLLAAAWLAAISLQIAVIQLITPDLIVYNIPWFDHIVASGPIAAFAAPFGNYSPPYYYLLVAALPLHDVIPAALTIKLVSFACTALLALAVWRLLIALRVAHAARWALVVPLLPSVMMSGAILGQCDALYAAPCVMAVAAAINRRHAAMFAWCGVAFAVKAQAIFIAPFVLAIIIARRIPVRLWLAAPLAYAALLLPAALAGWPVASLLTIYLHQSETFDDIARNAPNIWMIAQLGGITTPLVGLALATAVGAVAAYAARFGATARHFAGPMLLRLALLAPLIVAGLLPKMHDRYFFLADVLSLALAIAAPDRDTLRIQAHVQLGSVLALVGYLTGLPWLAAIGAVPMIAATILVMRPLLWRSANDNPLLMRVA